MKTMEQIQSLLSTFQQSYNWKQIDQAQQSKDWFRMRLGVLTASNAYKAIAKPGTETRNGYLLELVSQVATGESKSIDSYAVEWGKQMEGPAREAWSFLSGKPIAEVPFVFKDENFREGASPDGIILEDEALIEIKSPYSSVHHAASVLFDKIKPEYKIQQQFQLRVLGADKGYFCSYDPRFITHPLHIIEVGRDAATQAKFDELIPEFLGEMDACLDKLRIKWGSQWGEN